MSCDLRLTCERFRDDVDEEVWYRTTEGTAMMVSQSAVRSINCRLLSLIPVTIDK